MVSKKYELRVARANNEFRGEAESYIVSWNVRVTECEFEMCEFASNGLRVNIMKPN